MSRPRDPTLTCALVFAGLAALVAGGLVYGLGSGWLLAWVVGASLATLAAFGWDKSAARRGATRVPERVLLGLSLVGGSPGALVAMPLFRHKTVKGSFRLAMRNR